MERILPLVVAVLLCVGAWFFVLPLLPGLVVLAGALGWAMSAWFEEAPTRTVESIAPVPVLSDGQLLARAVVNACQEKSEYSFRESHCFLVVGDKGVGKRRAIEAFWNDDECRLVFGDTESGLTAYWNRTLAAAVIRVPSEMVSLATYDRQRWKDFCETLLALRGSAPLTGVVVVVNGEKQRQLQLDEFDRLSKSLLLAAAKGFPLPVWLVFTRCDRIQFFYEGGCVLRDRLKVHHLGILPDQDGKLDYAGFRASVWEAAVRSLKGPELQTATASKVIYFCGQLDRLAPDAGISAVDALHQRPLRLQGIWFGCGEHPAAADGATVDPIADDWPKSLLQNTVKVKSDGAGPLFFKDLFAGVDPATPRRLAKEAVLVAPPTWWTAARVTALRHAGYVGLAAAFVLSLTTIVVNRIEVASVEADLRLADHAAVARPGPRVDLDRERIERLSILLSRMRRWEQGDMPMPLRLFNATAATSALMRALFVRRFTDVVARPVVAQTETQLARCAPTRILTEDECRDAAARYLSLTGPREPGELPTDAVPVENVEAVARGWQGLYIAAGFSADRRGGSARLRGVVTLYLQVATDTELTSRDAEKAQIATSLLGSH